MAEKVLSVEIGYSLTKVCEIEKGVKSPKITNSFVIPTPEGTVNDGIVEVKDEFVSSFKIAMNEKKIRTKKVIFTIVSNRIVTKDVTIPFVKENRIKDVVRANITDYFPVDPSQYKFAHNVIGVVRDSAPEMIGKDVKLLNDGPKRDGVASNNVDNVPDSKKKAAKSKAVGAKATGYKLQVLAAPKPLYDSYERLAKALGLEIQNIDYNGNSIYQAAKEECKEGVQLIVKIDEKNSLLMVLENGVIALNRTIPYGIDDAVDAVRHTRAFGEINSYEEAMDMARRRTLILSNFKGELMAMDENSEDDNEILLADKKMVTDSLRMLAGGILRVIDYYNSNHSDSPIKKAYLTGIGADFSGIGTLLSDELEIKVKNLTHLAGIDGNRIFADATFGEFVTVIGAAINPLKFYGDQDENNKNKGKEKGKTAGYNPVSLYIAIGVLVLGILVSGGMILFTKLPYDKEKKLNEQYNQTIAELQPSYDVYQQFLLSEMNLHYMKQVLKASENRNNQLVEFIEYLEDRMPFSFCLNSIKTTTDTVTLEATVSTKEESAYVLDKLRECDMFTSADLTAVSYIETDLGEVLYGFTVDLNYAPIESEDADAEAVDGDEVVENTVDDDTSLVEE